MVTGMNENVDMFSEERQNPGPKPHQDTFTRNRAVAAMLAFAVGDAMGWPHEGRARAKGTRTQEATTFTKWHRSAGGRYYRHEDSIGAGEYSDDTQLMLAVARSVRCGNDWLRYFTTVELPFWLHYERGGGSATLRAAGAWTKHKAPWQVSDAKARSAYFEAGGNGCAMRVLPHAVWCQTEQELVARVDADATCTHGHPRAIVGARLYSVAAWHCLRQRRTLSFGELLDKVSTSQHWRSDPAVSAEWLEAHRATAKAANSFATSWSDVLKEAEGLLDLAAQHVQIGALAVDDEALRAMGVTDRYMGGAGTVTAAGAIYMASRNAAQPAVALRRTATLKGADTDTLAAMTSGLLGAFHGIDWLNSLASQVQDAEYIRNLAGTLADGIAQNSTRDAPSTDESISQVLDDARTRARVTLPGGRLGVVENISELAPRRKYSVKQWRIRAEDGQTFWVKRLSRRPAVVDADRGEGTPTATRPSQGTNMGQEPGPASSRRVGIRLLVRDLARSRRFYNGILGLPITKESRSSFSVAGMLTLTESPPEAVLFNPSTDFALIKPYVLHIEVDDLDSTLKRLMKEGLAVTEPITERGTTRQLRCSDADGHFVSLFQPVRQD